MVMATKPGTTVPVKVMRDKQEKTLNVTVGELDLDAETQTASRRTRTAATRTRAAGFGMSLGNITAGRARPLRAADEHDRRGHRRTSIRRPGGARRPRRGRRDPARRTARRCESAADAQRELQKVPSGGTAFLRVWRRAGNLRDRDARNRPFGPASRSFAGNRAFTASRPGGLPLSRAAGTGVHKAAYGHAHDARARGQAPVRSPSTPRAPRSSPPAPRRCAAAGCRRTRCSTTRGDAEAAPLRAARPRGVRQEPADVQGPGAAGR